MPGLRKCAKCSEPTMEPVARKMEIYNSVYAYKCSNCQHEVELEPIGGLGMQVTLGFLLAPIIWTIFMDDHGDLPSLTNLPTITQALILLAIVSYFPILAIRQKLKHRRYPLVETGSTSRQHIEMEETSAITKKPVMWIEKFGFLGGMLAPIVFIIIFLGLAAIIGFINFTFFNDKLFG